MVEPYAKKIAKQDSEKDHIDDTSSPDVTDVSDKVSNSQAKFDANHRAANMIEYTCVLCNKYVEEEGV